GLPVGSFPVLDEGALRQLADRGYFDEYETGFARRDGSAVVATMSGAMLGSAQDEPSRRAFAFVKDITERKRAEETLKKSEERFRTLYESSIDGIVNLDTEGRIADANKAYLDMLGYTLEEVSGLTYRAITPEKWHEMEDALVETQVNVRGYSRLYEKEYIRKDGTVFPVSVRRWVTKDETGQATGIWSIVRDVTDRKRNEEELQRINTELEGFAHSVSHDLRGPLSSVVLAVELLRDAVLESDTEVMRREVKDAERSIRRSVQRSYRLIDDLLSLAESGQQPVSPAEVNITDLVISILEENAPELEDHRVSFDMSDDLGVIRASQTHMYQLFSNLIMNAVLHNSSSSPEVKVLHLGTDSQERVIYRVCDNGRGIDEDDLENIFKPFFKKGGSSRTGVGLAIVDKVTGLYGGYIRAFNDNGACFEFAIKDWDPRPGQPAT
ncbi:MAG: PAS domain S-box protein, partial [Candidatus Geothermincolia bacterium]